MPSEGEIYLGAIVKDRTQGARNDRIGQILDFFRTEFDNMDISHAESQNTNACLGFECRSGIPDENQLNALYRAFPGSKFSPGAKISVITVPKVATVMNLPLESTGYCYHALIVGALLVLLLLFIDIYLILGGNQPFFLDDFGYTNASGHDEF